MYVEFTAELRVAHHGYAEIDARLEVEPTSVDPDDGFDLIDVEVKCFDGGWRRIRGPMWAALIEAAPSDSYIDELLREDGAWPSRDQLRREAEAAR